MAGKLKALSDGFRFYREGIGVMKLTLPGTAAEEAAIPRAVPANA